MNSGELNLKRVYEVEGRITEEGLRNSSTKLIPARSVLIGLAGQGRTRGTVAMNMLPLCTNQSIAAILPNEGTYDSDFLFHNLSNRYEELRSLSSGDEGRGGLNLQLIKGLPVPMPSLAEQQKIGACLTSLDDWIDAEDQRLAALKVYKKGLIQRLFPREGEASPRMRFAEFQDAREWESTTMEEIASIVRGGSPRPIDAFLTDEFSGLNWLKIGDVEEGAKYVTKTEQKVKKEALSKTRLIKPGDFILSNSMSFGRPYISQIETCIHDGWIAVTKIKSDVDHEFLYYAIMSHRSQRYFNDRAAGGGVRNLTTDIVKALPLTLGDQTEQRKIAAFLSSLDVLLANVARHVDSLRAHKNGLMQQLFPSVGANN